jgi:hypothetical protein
MELCGGQGKPEYRFVERVRLLRSENWRNRDAVVAFGAPQGRSVNITGERASMYGIRGRVVISQFDQSCREPIHLRA